MKKLTKILFICLGLLLGAALSALSRIALSRIPGLSVTEELGLNILVLLMLYVFYLVGIILHEAGHLVFGLATGWRFVSFRIANVIWLRGKDGRIRRGRHSLAGTAGQCLLAPPPWREEGFPYALYNMGGVIANLATALICGLLAAILWSHPLAALLLMEAALVSLFMGIVNGVPLPGMVVDNDGSNQRHLRVSRDARRALWIEMSVAKASAEGLLLDEMPDQWFEPFPEESLENPMVSSIAVLAQERLLCALDLPGAEAAARALLQREKGLIPLHRALVTLDGAFCELVGGHPGEMTEAMDKPPVPQLMKSLKRSTSVLRTQYAEALLRQHDEALAAKYAEAFEEVAETYPYPHDVENERALMALAKEAAA